MPNFSENFSKQFWLTFAVLFVTIFLFNGKALPYSNEFVYLLRLAPDFLPNDWTFSQPANEHWLFNALFSLPVYFLSLETTGWLGRIAVWGLCLFALLKLGKRWEISFWATSISVFLWLAAAQAVVNDEWIFGGFEAKTVAYACLLFALDRVSNREIILPSVLLGLSFSFHPAVGLWAIPAIGLVLLFEKIPTADFVKVVVITGLFSLLGLVPLFAEQNSVTANSFDDWQFIVTTRVPWHLDPFQFPIVGIFLVFAMLIFNVVALWKTESFALRFLLEFQIALGFFFLFGVILRLFELYPLLRFMPMRLFPVFTPIFFLFTAFRFVPQIRDKKYKIIAALFVVSAVFLLNPLREGFYQLEATYQSWTKPPTDLQKSWLWIAHNTPPNALVIEPPHTRELWYFPRRATVASYGYPTFDRLGEWRERISDLTGGLRISDGEKAGEEIETAYNNLTAAQIEAIKTKYGATHLVSRAQYPYPIIFETETYKVYRLP